MPGPFVDASTPETKDVPVPCACEGTPHKNDTVTIRSVLSGGEISQITGSMFAVDEGGAHADISGRDLLSMQMCVLGWSFVDKSGAPIPFDPGMVNKLRGDIWMIVSQEVDKLVENARLPFTSESDSTEPSKSTSTPESPASTPVSPLRSLSSFTPSPDSASKTLTPS